jgi:hypothetical protein
MKLSHLVLCQDGSATAVLVYYATELYVANTNFQMAILMLHTHICFLTCDFHLRSYILYFQK